MDFSARVQTERTGEGDCQNMRLIGREEFSGTERNRRLGRASYPRENDWRKARVHCRVVADRSGEEDCQNKRENGKELSSRGQKEIRESNERDLLSVRAR